MAKKRYPKSEVIVDTSLDGAEAYVAWGDDLDSKNDALKRSSESLSEYGLVNKSTASRRYGVDFSNLTDNTGGRPGLTRADYEFFRPDEAVPQQIKAIGRKAEDIYYKVGLVRNVIDLMADFAVQGIMPCHRNKRIERFYRHWFKQIDGKDRSERFLNNLYRTGAVVANRQTAKLNVRVTEELFKSMGSPDMQADVLDMPVTQKREVPWKYTFIDPTCVEVAGGSLASFVPQKIYQIILPAQLRKLINSPKNDVERAIVQQLPPDIIAAAQAKKAYRLDPEKTIVCHYKKDDWQSWAYPMIYSIMDDIFIVEKLKLADLAALDGAISNIRIFKLGSLQHKIAPTKAATAKLAAILGNNVGGGTMDLIWGPDIELIESKTAVHQFLGQEKYMPHLNSIYAGLGIPPTLTGTFGAAGTTNNFISLKTMTQRLQYGRDVITKFWEKEFEIVQKAMGFRYPAKIEFDRMDLSNEDSEKALLIQLADRNVISDELLQKRFGFDPDMEKSRLNREHRDRKSNRMIRKAGPWHDPQIENSLKKIALQGGAATPSQVGLEMDKKKSGEKTILEMRQATMPSKLAKDSPESLPGVPGQGRPKTKKDSTKRKEKTFTPRTGASLNIWAIEAQDKISEIINPIMLEMYNKKNMRSLANVEVEELDKLKTQILFSLKPFSKINEEIVKASMTEHSPSTGKLINDLQYYLHNISSQLNRSLTVDEVKQAKACFFSDYHEFKTQD